MRLTTHVTAGLLAALSLLTNAAHAQDPSALVARMTIDEKFWQLFMIPGDLSDTTHDYSKGVFGLQVRTHGSARQHAEQINAIQKYLVEHTRLGIPMLPFEEAAHGLLADGATSFPQAIALAATWDTALVASVYDAVARETRSRGIRQVLSPVINIATDQRWGRVEETFGEDPLLTSKMAVATVRAFERAGVVATPKHFIANVGEGGRDSYPIEVSRRVLEEVHFPPFKAAISNGARSVMTAYNSVDGTPSTQNAALLSETLKRDWGFTGFVISDAAATGGATVLHHTEASTASATKHALESGLDVIFQSSWPQHRPYLAAFKSGTISDSAIDAAVTRVLRAKMQLGLFEHPYANPDSAAYWNGHAEHRALAREAARASMVLLKNERNALPLTNAARIIAVIGTDATEARLGGYSGPGNSPVNILDAIRRRAGRTTVRYAAGPGRITTDHVVVPAANLKLKGEYFANNTLEGTPAISRNDANIDFGWTLNSPGRGIPYDWYSVRWTGRITAPRSGASRLGVEGNDGYRLYIDGKLTIDNWRKQSYRTTLANVQLKPNTQHDIRLEYFESTGNARVKLVWDAGIDASASQKKIDDAVAIARRSDVAIVVAGLEEGEFRDRSHLTLPGQQEQLIRAVAKTGTPTIVVIIGGSAVITTAWQDDAAAILDAWYPGEKGGNAVADILFGDADPAGRLPMTWPVSEGQLPLVYNHKPTGRGDDYLDGTGQPHFPFGFGLSYTTFSYTNLSISKRDDSVQVKFTITNTGKRAGDEVAQLYLHDDLASVARPVTQLAAFQRVRLAPGESRELTMTLGPEHFELLDRDMKRVREPGTFRIMVGASSRDIRLRQVLTLP